MSVYSSYKNINVILQNKQIKMKQRNNNCKRIWWVSFLLCSLLAKALLVYAGAAPPSTLSLMRNTVEILMRNTVDIYLCTNISYMNRGSMQIIPLRCNISNCPASIYCTSQSNTERKYLRQTFLSLKTMRGMSRTRACLDLIFYFEVWGVTLLIFLIMIFSFYSKDKSTSTRIRYSDCFNL